MKSKSEHYVHQYFTGRRRLKEYATHTTEAWAMPYAIPDISWFPSSTSAARPFPLYIVNRAEWVRFVLVNFLLLSIRGDENNIIVFLGDENIYRAPQRKDQI